MGATQKALDELAAARAVLDQAADRLLELAEEGLNAEAGADLSPLFHQLLEACSFNDLAGQRLARVSALLTQAQDTRPDAALMNGPGAHGLNQGQTDSLMSLRLPKRLGG